MSELLCYGSLMMEGHPIRLSGQDAIRGTFTHRQSMFYDCKSGERYSPLTTIRPEDVEFCVYDSLLSEYAVLGFEYGNSSSDPTFLTIWEAQFGDFANGAQIIIDQFISSAEQKWQRMSGLVLLLPHGYEGQGPEHSSARLERFLQLSAQDNWQIVNMTSPAQFFHALRRQMKREWRKPLIVMSPKSLLRHPLVVSKMSEFTEGAFQETLTHAPEPKAVESVIFCSGKIYFDLLASYEQLEKKDQAKIAMIRLEQIYPFPEWRLKAELKKFPKLKMAVWAQEEPKNMGAWSFVASRLQEVFSEVGANVLLRYIGRSERASPATGSEKVHAIEQKEIIQNCFFGLNVLFKKNNEVRSL